MLHRRLPALIPAACIVCVPAAPGFEEPVVLPPVSAHANELPPGMAAGTLPSLLGPEVWDARSTATLGDILTRAPGVLLQESFGGFEPPRLSIRGSGIQSAPASRGVSFLLDGLPLCLADGSFNSALFDPRLAGHIEVRRGGSAGERAGESMGGVLDLITLPASGGPDTLVRAEGGSSGARRALATGRTTWGAATLSGGGSWTRQEGWRPNSAQERYTLLGGLALPLPNEGIWDLDLMGVRARYEVPGPLTLAAEEDSPRSVSAAVLRDRPRRESEMFRMATRVLAPLEPFTLEGGASWIRSTDDFLQLQPNGATCSTGDDLAATLALSRSFNAAGMEHAIRAGASSARGWRDTRRHLNMSGDAGALFGRADLTAANWAVFAEDSIALLPDLTATLGCTLSGARRDIDDRFSTAATPAAITRSMHSSAILPRAALSWEFRPGASLFAGVSTAAEPPTFDDLLVTGGTHPNLVLKSQSLKTQRATTVELGTRGAAGRTTWELTGYTGWWRDEILRLADAQGLPRGAVNAGRTRHMGVEAAGSWRIVDAGQRLTLSGSGNLTRATFDDDPVYGDGRLAGIPPLQGVAELLYEHPCGGFAAAALDWTCGHTGVDHAGDMAYPGRTLVHLRGGWRLGQNWTLFADLRNLFDRDYIASTAGVLDRVRSPVATAVFLPGTGRSLTLGLEWRK